MIAPPPTVRTGASVRTMKRSRGPATSGPRVDLRQPFLAARRSPFQEVDRRQGLGRARVEHQARARFLPGLLVRQQPQPARVPLAGSK